MSKYHDILKQYWGYDDFRPLQLDIIESIGNGHDTLGLMPTGGGKSITFQVPALTMDGVCLVITPLIALMKDQVQNLRDRGIQAKAIFSGLTNDEITVALDNCILGGCKFLYVSPERLSSETFNIKLKQMKVSMIVVDEAHCISQWGFDFRPSYKRISEVRAMKPDAPVLALTATATEEVVKDIMESLAFRKKKVFTKSFKRDNIAYMVHHTEDKEADMLKILNRIQGTGIVYVRSRKKTWETARFLNSKGIPTAFYHAGMTNKEKDQVQRDWQAGIARVIVCTNAFGMGIDKPDVRTVIHLDAPESIEAYFQEAGRAGRDGNVAYAVMLWSGYDAAKLRRATTNKYPEPDEIKAIYNSLCNSETIALGSGCGHVCEFDIEAFCNTYKYWGMTVHSSLAILTNAGYIDYQEEIDLQSRVIFIVERGELYNIQMAHPDLDVVIKALLRLYTGLFTEYAIINEDTVARMCQLDRQEVYNRLKALARLKVIIYNPQKHTSLVIWTRERVHEDEMVFPHSVYRDRKADTERRITAMIDYCERNDTCRSQLLLEYFGESGSQPCGHCDICNARKREGSFDSKRLMEIENNIKENGLLSELPEDAIVYLMDRGIITSDDGIEYKRLR